MYTAATEVHHLGRSLRSQDVLDRWHNPHARADQLRELHAAVHDWQQWATGKPIPLERVAIIAATLRTADQSAGARPLADVLDQWATINRIEISQLARSRTGPSLELGL